ncbi:hypothetical protein [uncultured Adlercreutzia sp.]|uniref:hypothetical protein n=1 Tax=uncultured Adlercreutzia sp. TaxID=875803 RepID=UPI0025FB8B9B|nr:hypothetical protein [uncultured Adlercreutzia sp.]
MEDRARTGRGRAALAALGLLLAAAGALVAFTIAFADVAWLVSSVHQDVTEQQVAESTELAASEEPTGTSSPFSGSAQLSALDLAAQGLPLRAAATPLAAAGASYRYNTMDQVLSVAGPYRFNAAGNSNCGGRYGSWGTPWYSSRYPASSIGASLPDGVGGTKNSSSGYLTQTTNRSRIARAYLVVSMTQRASTYNTMPLATYGFYFYGPKGGGNFYQPQTMFLDGANSRVSCYYDVTSFVKGQGYGWYSCVNIPFGNSGTGGTDCFAAWKLVVVEEDTSLPTRMVRLKLGGDGVATGNSSYVTIDGDGLTTGAVGGAAPTGELVVGLDGGDMSDSSQMLNYRTSSASSVTAVYDNRVLRAADKFFTMQVDVLGTRATLDPAARTARTGSTSSAGNLTLPGVNNGLSFTQSNTDLSVMRVNDAANAGSPSIGSGLTSVGLSVNTSKNPTLLSVLGMALDVKVPLFQSNLIVTNERGNGVKENACTTTDAGYAPTSHYALPGDRLKLDATCDNVSGGSSQIGVRNASMTVSAPAFASIDVDSIDARYIMPDGTVVELTNVTVLGTTVTAAPQPSVNLATGGRFEITFTGPAKSSETYTAYESSMSVTGTFVDEQGTTHSTVLDKLGSAYTTTASDKLRYRLDVRTVAGTGTAAASGSDSAKDETGVLCYPGDSTVKASGAAGVNNYLKALVVDGVVRDDLLSGDGAWSLDVPMNNADHTVYAAYAPGDKPVRDFYPVETAGDGGVGSLTPTTLVAAGDSHQVSWRAAEGHRIVSVTVDGAPIPVTDAREGSLAFDAVGGDHRVEVRTEPAEGGEAPTGFALRTQILGGEGSITPSELSVPAGESRDVSWVLGAGWKVRSIEVNGKVLGGQELEGAVALGTLRLDDFQSNCSVVVTLCEAARPDPSEKENYDIQASWVGEGTVGPTASVEAGGAHTVTWKASSGYAVLMVEVDGVPRPDLMAQGQSGSLRFEDVGADHEVFVRFTTAAFEPPSVKTHSVALEVRAGKLTGSVYARYNLTTDGFGTYEEGASPTVCVTHAKSVTGYPIHAIKEIYVDGVQVEKSTATWSRTFTDLSSDHLVTVVVESASPTTAMVQVTTEGPGTAGPSGAYKTLGSFSVSTAPYPGARVTEVLINGKPWSSFGTKATWNGATLSCTNWSQYANSSEKTVTVHVVFAWREDRVPVTTRVSGGPGTITGTGDVPVGRSTDIAWTPAENWHVDKILVNGAERPDLLAQCGTGSARHTFSGIADALDVEVVVAPDPPKLTAEAVPAEGGTAAAPAEGTVAWGEPATFTWAAAEGWRVASITANGLPIYGGAAPLYEAVGNWTAPAAKGPIHFKVTYEPLPTFRVAVATEGNGEASVTAGGEAAAAQTVMLGGSAEVSWAPAAGWRVAGVWDGDGQIADSSDGPGSYRFDDIRAAHEVRVVFERAVFTVTTHADDALGTITGTAEVPRGADHVVSWSVHDPEKAFVEDVLVDGASAGDAVTAGGRYEFANVAADHDVAARFARIPDKALVVVTASGGGEGHLVGGAGPAFPAGSSTALGWTAQEGYTVKGAQLAVSDADRNPVAELSRVLTADEVTAGLADGFTLENLREGHLYELHLTFELTRFALSTSSEGQGAVTPTYEETWGSDARVAFTPAAGWKVASVTVDGVESVEAAAAGFVVFRNLKAGHKVHVTFAPIMLGLSITGTPVAGGSVSFAAATPDGTAVSRDGGAAGRAEATLPWGSRAALAWQPAEGWRVKTLTVNGAAAPLPEEPSWPVASLERDTDVAVTFERIPCQVTATGAPAQGGTVAGGGTVLYGDAATVTYEARPGWHVAAVEVDGAPWPVEAFPSSVTLADVRADHAVAVTFERDSHPLTLTVSDKDGGTIIGPTTVLHGEDATVTWKAAEGWAVTAVSIDGVPVDVEATGGAAGGATTFAAVSGPHAVHVTVERLRFPVSCAVAEGNGSISPSSTAAFGDDVKISWEPARGWKVREVLVDGTPLSADEAAAGTLTLSDVRAAHRVEVAFARQVFRIETFADRALGTLTASADVPFGEDFPVRWSPNAGAYVAGAEADGASVDDAALAAGEYWFRNVSAPHTFAVEFAKVPGKALVAVVASGEGTFSVADGSGAAREDGLFNPGETARVGWQPAEGWRVAGATLAVTGADGVRGDPVALDDAQLAAALEGALRLPVGDGALQEDFIYQISVAFEPVRYPITTAAGPAEGGVITASYEVTHGSDAAVSIVPNPGWRVAEVMVDGAADDAAAEAGRVGFAAVTGPHAVVATFEQIMCRVSISAGPEGSGTVAVGGAPGADASASASAELPWGSPATLQWRPAEGWRVSSVAVNGAAQPGLAAGAEAWETASLSEDVSVEVAFDRIRCGVLVSVSDPAGATVTAPDTVAWGDDARVTWATEPGWHVVRVIVNGEERPDLAVPGVSEVLLEAVRSGQSVHVEVARDDAGNPGGPVNPGPDEPTGPEGPAGPDAPDDPSKPDGPQDPAPPDDSGGSSSPGRPGGSGGFHGNGSASSEGGSTGANRPGGAGSTGSSSVGAKASAAEQPTVVRHLAQTSDGVAALTLALAAAALAGALTALRAHRLRR